MQIKLKPFQDRFVFSKARYPAFIAGWGTGKTMCAIIRGQVYSELIPNNLGMILRKEYTDLRDSTVKDFEKYTGIKVNSQRNAILSNGSQIMFRHLEELKGNEGKNIQNINLGWFFIEQAEEMATDEEFFFLLGRLRRDLKPSESFNKEELPLHSGFVTGNVKGDNWIRQLWKLNPEPNFNLTEATTFENADNLPADFLKDLELVKKFKPSIYERYVMNDWEAAIEGKVFRNVQACAIGQLGEPIPGEIYCIGTDVAKYRDFWVNIVMDSRGNVKGFDRSNQLDWSFQKQRLFAMAKKWNNASVIIDSTGVGDPIFEDLERMGLNIHPYHFTNQTKKELIENLALLIEQQKITYPPIPELIDELLCFENEVTAANNLRFNAPQGKNDDCVVALGLVAYEWCNALVDLHFSSSKESRVITKDLMRSF